MAYTNSPLVSYTKLSPNHSGQRTHVIDRITPHCVVGQLSAESICSCFTSPDRQASCNYGIGYDGKVSLCVEEKNRSWCTSSRENDQRAVTIECASDSTHPYAFKDAVYNRLIELCTDICKRNGKKKLLWLGDKEKTLNYNPASDEMVLTVHRWYANKSCPGDWMYARMDDLASKVTAALGGMEQSTTISTTDAEKTIWDFLLSKLGNAYGVAGMMGNLYAESALRPANLQNTFEKKLGLTDAEYTEAVDDGSYTNFVRDSAGYGLAQWTYWSRKQALLDFANAAGKSIGDLKMQLDFLWKELQGYKTVLDALKNAISVRAASDVVLTGYERPADMGDAVKVKRAGFGQTYYDKYAGGQSSTVEDKPTVTAFPAVPFTVRVLIPDLNYRSAPSMDGTIKGQTGKGTFTITQVSNGWGKLKSGAGWIYLGNPEYCTVKGTVAQATPSFTPYKVKVSIPDLNIRKKPTVNSKNMGFTGKGVFTIVEEAQGAGSKKGWGRLKSGAGWIALDHAKKV